MSDNPFLQQPNANPYASPTSQSGSESRGNPLLIPALFILIFASIFLLFICISIPGQLIELRTIDTTKPEGSGYLVGYVGAMIMLPLMNLIDVVGAILMLRLTGYRIAYTAAILSVIPICSPCYLLGIPFGIWAIVLLNRPDVKQLFMRE